MNRRLKGQFWRFVKAMAAQDYPQAVKYTQKTWQSVAKQQSDYLAKYEPMDWANMQVVKVEQTGTCSIDVKFTSTNSADHVYTSRWICETKPYGPSLRGVWGVNPYSIK